MGLQKNSITGIVLAGGKSSRMGYDKGLAETGEGKLIERVVGVLKQVTGEVIIISNNNSYNYLGLPVFEDVVKECGPLGGIYTGLFYSKNIRNLIVACDMPFVSAQLLTAILNNSIGRQVVIPSVNNKLEPLCGYYNKNILEQMKESIDNKNYSVHKVVTHFNHVILPFNEDSINFTNINTPDDLFKIKKT